MSDKKKKVAMFPLTNDPKANVKGKGNQRLNTAIKAIKTLGDCCTKDYDWTEEQIQNADKLLLAAMEQAVLNLQQGKAAASKAGIPQLI